MSGFIYRNQSTENIIDEEDVEDSIPKKNKRMGLIHLGHNFKSKVPKRIF